MDQNGHHKGKKKKKVKKTAQDLEKEFEKKKLEMMEGNRYNLRVDNKDTKVETDHVNNL